MNKSANAYALQNFTNNFINSISKDGATYGKIVCTIYGLHLAYNLMEKAIEGGHKVVVDYNAQKKNIKVSFG